MFRIVCSLIALSFLFANASAQTGWVLQTSNTNWPLFGVHASNGHTATAVGDVSTILRTTDAGQTWTPQTGENGQVFTCVSFCDDSNGVIGGPNGLTIYTHNAGALWQTAQVGEIIWYTAVQQLTPQWGIVGGVNTINQPLVTITTNGWQSFDSHIFYPFHNGSNQEGTIYGLHFLNPDTGFAALEIFDGEGAICRTTDGGVTWATVDWNAYAYYGVDFWDNLHGCAVGANGVVALTSDGGETWEHQTYPTSSTLNSVSFGSVNEVWAVGQNALIIHSTNGGASWVPQENPASFDMYAVSFVNADSGYAVGDYGTIIFTATGGRGPNQPPGAFTRTTPPDGAYVEGPSGPIEFAWSTSVDPDSDQVEYFLRVWSTNSPQPFDTTAGTSNTSVMMTLPLSGPPPATYTVHWTVKATDGIDTISAANGEGIFHYSAWIDEAEAGSALPREFALSAYPNPFNPITTLNLSLPVSSEATLRIFDITGRLVRENHLGRLSAGIHAISFDGSELPSGIYMAVSETPTAKRTQKLILLK